MGDRGRAVAGANLVECSVEKLTVVDIEGKAELEGKVVLEIGDRDADHGQPTALDLRLGGDEQGLGGGEDRAGLRGRVPKRAGAGRPAVVAEAEAEDDRAADAFRRTKSASDAVDDREEVGLDLGG